MKPDVAQLPFQALAAQNLPLVYAQARRYSKHNILTYDDLVSEGCLALVYAARTFNPSHGVTFSTYAVPGITRLMNRALRRRLRSALPQGPALEGAPAREPVPPPCLPSGADLETALARLRPASRRVLALRYGLGGRGRLGWPQVAAKLCCDAERAKRLYRRAIYELRREMERV